MCTESLKNLFTSHFLHTAQRWYTQRAQNHFTAWFFPKGAFTEASFPESYNYPSTAANNDEREQKGEEDRVILQQREEMEAYNDKQSILEKVPQRFVLFYVNT